MFKTNNKELIKFNHVCFGYKPNQTILDNVSFSILENEHVCIIGSIGCGKSTLAKLIVGLFKPTIGEIVFQNQIVTKSNVKDLKASTGIIFEDPNSQFISLTVEDDIAFGLENKQVPREQMQSIINAAAKEVGITDLLKSAIQNLSGGQKQLVAIASVLAMNPKLIVFDEVTSMLDSQSKNHINNLIDSLKKKHNKTIVTITHDMHEAVKADKIIVMNKGKIVMVGKPNEIFKNFNLEKLSLDKPFNYKLNDQLKNKSIKKIIKRDDDAQVSPIIKSKNLSICFGSKKKRTTLINNFNFVFNKNKIYAIIGNSGVGKTTLVSHFNGLIKSPIGNIHVNDISILGTNKKIRQYKRLRKTVGFVFQFPEHQLFKDTVEKDILFGPNNFKIKQVDAAKYLQLVGLDPKLLKANPFDLSNGQKRLVAIASVLASDPEVIIFDEPTAGLDPSSVRKIINIICQLKHEGKTIIIITHNMDNVLELADEVLVIDNHKLLTHGTPYQIFTNSKLINKVGINQPEVIKYWKSHSLKACKPRSLDELVYFLKKGGK